MNSASIEAIDTPNEYYLDCWLDLGKGQDLDLLNVSSFTFGSVGTILIVYIAWTGSDSSIIYS